MIYTLKEKHILFLEDNEEFAQNFMALLELFVHKIFHCNTLEIAYNTLQTQKIDIIISDIKVHHENALSFIETVRHTNTTIPIIVLSGNKNEEFLLRAIPLNLMAYLLKPVKYKELIETLNRCSISLSASNHLVLKNGYAFDKHNRILFTNEGYKIDLNKKETAFVELLIEHQNRVVSKTMMYETLWNFDDVSEQALLNFVMRFRKKVGKQFIQTVNEAGYRLGLS
ncbi:response regulator transcription factor [Sulfurospirillum barnesii]|uniref:Response regulator with CheY-like receiver domain and winged-helix DNA-binding domain n=1 Tax=Sulfurospirillum barnesii (strain ATCC 700032 / DSM 10660 / SES-3) TaxID=760154 RepID=I3XW45_SULBS|nr:response regulator [Sulfurospirillum barnesii]AFL68169.1 response regulator with CheY-like receiver domain and winged-helix DNA-binding domain [Sulfurospirillum barnesii SES-3]